MREKLRTAFENKDWSGHGRQFPRSGPGSDLESTAPLREALPGIFERYAIKTFVDAPCGDWFWMKTVDLSGVDYVGADISSRLVAQNSDRFARPGVRFVHLDITSDPLPASDLFLCRDCLFHLKFWLRWAFFENFGRSGGRYLMQTMHHVSENVNVRTNGGFQLFNPVAAPFNLPEPLETIVETTEGLERSLGIWSREQIVETLARREPLASGETE